ncbi:MAG TPA: 2,5-diamino-6-(ribosylamino)-4(3H)-pyrimidinone 5'-phosphate reductase [Methanomassiliicoccales archaeon]|nr:2,5-diamino-6-(ribosylamino)-4(3H)-pyrimidinone 5'-phosphate reductase [Methanomassiliicoccales archaeon]
MRPHVIINCAMSADGKIAGKSRKQVRISSQEDLERVRKLRSESEAILVGVNTVLADDPHLTVKGLSREEGPIRIVLDSNGRTPDGAKVLNEGARTLIVTNKSCARTWPGAEALRIGEGLIDLHELMRELEARKVQRLMVEGGGETIWSFFKAGLVDEYRVFVGSIILGGRTAPSPVDGEGFEEACCVRLQLKGTEALGDGVLLCYEVVRDAPQT